MRQQILYFGKLPGFGDFIRSPLSKSAKAFEEWLYDSVVFAKTHADKNWPKYIQQLSPMRFIYAAKPTSSILVGLIYPSEDKNGRSYPFVIFAELDTIIFKNTLTHLLPLLLNNFFYSLRNLYEKIFALNNLTEIDSHVEPGLPDFQVDMNSAQRLYDKYVKQTALETFNLNIWGSIEKVGLQLTMQNMLNIIGPIQRRPIHKVKIGLRIPLGHKAQIRSFEACFWLDVLSRLWHKSVETPVIFWDLEVGEMDSGMWFFFQRPTNKGVGYMLSKDLHDDHVCNLDTDGALDWPYTETQMYQRLNSPRILLSEMLTLSENSDEYLVLPK